MVACSSRTRFCLRHAKGELLGLRVKHVNFLDETIRLESAMVKNREARVLMMTPTVRELLKIAVHGKRANDHVLTWRTATRFAISATRGRTFVSGLGWASTFAASVVRHGSPKNASVAVAAKYDGYSSTTYAGARRRLCAMPEWRRRNHEDNGHRTASSSAGTPL